jgi:hypothetical protein
VKIFYTGGGEKFMGRGEKNSYVKTLKPFKKKKPTSIMAAASLALAKKTKLESQKYKTREPKFSPSLI